MNLLKIKKQIIKDTKPVWHDAICKELGINTLIIEGGSSNEHHGAKIKKIVIDGHQITNVTMDQYNNTHCSIGKQIPVEYLPIFGRILNELYFVHNYNGRANYGIHVRYFERFSKELSLEDIKTMFKTGNGCKNDKSEGFREWLLGSFKPESNKWHKTREDRPSDCNIPCGYHLTYTELAALWEHGYRKTYWELESKKEMV